MIYGEIKDLNQYKGISENLDRAIEYIVNGEYKKSTPGKNVIDGDNLYFNYPSCAMTKEIEDGFFEGHKKIYRYTYSHIRRRELGIYSSFRSNDEAGI